MEKQSIDHLFKRLDKKLDTASPSTDHKVSFLAKLQAQAPQEVAIKKETPLHWMRPLFIAASMILLAGFIYSQFQGITSSKELADISPEMEETQDFFTKTIERELFEIKENTTPENQALVLDAIAQLENLEKEYNNLKNDLSVSGEDKRVIYAMIDNFQNRIDLLQDVVEQMDTIKELNNPNEAITL